MTFHPLNPLRGIALDIVRSTAEWCAEHVYLSPRIPTARPGQWRPENVAALCRPGGPLDALDDPNVETVVITKGSQTALTTTAYCWLAHCCATDPGSALIVMNSTQDARDKSAETWRPLWEDSPRLKPYLPTDRRKEWTKLYQLLNRSPVYWIGANSAGRLGAKPIRRLILDEVDKYPSKFGGDAGREAGAAALAKQRTKTFRQSGLAKILEFSTPTIDTGEITRSYEAGDQRKLYVRCHACRQEQVMSWAQFKIDMDLSKRDPGAAVAGCHYVCPHCQAPWTDAQRWTAIDGGEWRATVQAQDPRCQSFRLPSWCSKLVTASYLAAQWIKAQESKSALQDFINSECGEPFNHYENCIKDDVFGQLEGAYSETERWVDVPPYAETHKGMDSWVIAGVDVQKGYLVATFRLFVAGGDSGRMWAGTCSDFAALHAKVEEHKADFIFIDQKYRTREVQEWCYDHKGYVPCYGVKTSSRSVFTINNFDLDEGKRGQSRGRVIEVISHDGDQIKDIMATMIDRRPGARRWMLPRGGGAKGTYTAQMSAERCVNGRWVNPGNRPNHAWDAEALTIVGALRLGILQVGAGQ